MTLQKKWAQAAADAHDALFRLHELQEQVEGLVDEEWGGGDEREEEIQALTDLDIPGALEMAQLAEDVTLPSWGDVQ